MAYYQQPSPDEEKPPGCMDALLITRAVFEILLWPLVVMFAVFADIGLTTYLFATRPLLALIPLAVTVAGIAAFVWWERDEFQPPDVGDL